MNRINRPFFQKSGLFEKKISIIFLADVNFISKL